MSGKAVPILPAKSISDTRQFYARAGFQVLFEDDLHYGYLIVERDGVELQFFRHPEVDPYRSDHGAYIRCQSVDEIHGWFLPLDLKTTGIPRLEFPSDRPWNMREAYLVDPNGNLVRLGQPVSH